MNEAPTFQPGDSVVLKDGGPVMKVVARSLTLVYCTWIDYDGVAQSGTFEADSLRPEADLAAEGLAAASAAMLNAPPAAVPMQMVEPEPPPTEAVPPVDADPPDPGAAP